LKGDGSESTLIVGLAIANQLVGIQSQGNVLEGCGIETMASDGLAKSKRFIWRVGF